MNQPQTTCPQCGAKQYGIIGSDGRVRCEYCSTPLRVESRSVKSPQLPAQTAFVSQVDETAPSQGLPAEFRQLSRPKSSPSLESSGCGLIFGLFWTLFSFIFVVAGVGFYISGYQKYDRLVREGVPGSATIIKLEIDDSGDSTSYFVYYQFLAAVQGKFSRFDARESVSSAIYRSLKVEQEIEILWAESDPTISTIKAEFKPPDLLFSLIFSGMGGLFVLIGLAVMYGSLKAQGQLRDLRARGREVSGFIFERWKDKDSDGDSTYFVAFAFKVNSQIITRAEQNKALYDRYQVGDSLMVRYLPDDPSVCQARIEP